MVNDLVRIEVCTGCISYLLQRYDRNLFITSEPLSTVRKLKNDLLQCNDVLKRCREVHNPQLIADSILMLLKEINQCVLHEIYQDIVKLDLKEDIRHLKVQIRQLIVRLSPLNFDFIKKLFYLLNKASTSCDVPLAGQTIGESISPTLCFLTDSAYFSIRHKEDLITIQPVIVCMINCYHDIFTNELRPVPSVINPNITQLGKDSSKIGEPDKYKSIGKLSLTHSDNTNHGYQSKLISSNNDPVIILNSTVSSTNYNNNAFETSNFVLSQPLPSKTPDITGWQWKIVESLVFNCVASSMKLGVNESRKIINDSHILSGSKPKRTAQSLGNNSDTSKSRYARTNKDSNFSNSTDITNDSMDHSFVKRAHSTRRSNFKRLLSDFKGVRSQISAFEAEFTKVNNRAPKQGDRGPVESIYNQYSALKRKIRDFAASEIERIARGYLTRKRLRNFASKVNMSNRPNIPQSANTHGNVPPVLTLNELYALYRDIRSQKHELKRRLKQFDVDFEAKYHRAPEKSDKEVVRPLYQKYQALKVQLDDLQKIIENSHGRVPDDLLDRDNLSDSRDVKVQHQYSRVNMSNSSPLNLNISNDNIENRLVANTSETVERYDLNKSSPQLTGDLSLPVHNNSSNQNNSGVAMTIEQLQQEKTNLWTYLKAYEKDFTRRNGRQVTSTADITPVVREYQRYKEIKLQLITLQGSNNVN